ncbi:MAG: hypothetical protein CMJ90_01530 [Planctomycetes bacterium]|nr:hypothetical protein [Planctomycetota bacterium]
MNAAAIVVIGNEILSGKVQDRNSPFLIRELRELGVPVKRVATIPDEVDVIGETVRRYADRFAHVITCGGIGPTLDDVTFEGIARAFDLPLRPEPALERVIREHVGERITDAHLRMTKLPEGTELLWAEGLPWPATYIRNVLALPGSPELVEKKWRAIRERFRASPFVLCRIYLGIDEAAIAADLQAVDAAFPSVDIGSYPVFAPVDHETEITLECKDAEVVAAAKQALLSRLEPSVVVRIE